MRLNDLKAPEGANKRQKRLGGANPRPRQDRGPRRQGPDRQNRQGQAQARFEGGQDADVSPDAQARLS